MSPSPNTVWTACRRTSTSPALVQGDLRGIVDYLRKMGARNILFDMVFSEFSKKGVIDDRLFIEEIKKYGSVYLTTSFMNSVREKKKNAPSAGKHSQQLGPGLLEAILKRTGNKKDKALLKKNYRTAKTTPGTLLKKGLRYRTRKKSTPS